MGCIKEAIMDYTTQATVYMTTHHHKHKAARCHLPLHKMALLRPRASAVFEFIFSTTLCLTFFRTVERARKQQSPVRKQPPEIIN